MESSSIIETIDAEESDLQTHVSLCHQRYLQLTKKLDSVDTRITRIENSIADLKETITNQQSSTNKTYLNVTVWTIGILLATLGFLLAKFVII